MHQHAAGCTLPGSLKANLVPDYAGNHLFFTHRGSCSDSSRGLSAQMYFADMSDSRRNTPKRGPEPGLAFPLHHLPLSSPFPFPSPSRFLPSAQTEVPELGTPVISAADSESASDEWAAVYATSCRGQLIRIQATEATTVLHTVFVARLPLATKRRTTFPQATVSSATSRYAGAFTALRAETRVL